MDVLGALFPGLVAAGLGEAPLDLGEPLSRKAAARQSVLGLLIEPILGVAVLHEDSCDVQLGLFELLVVDFDVTVAPEGGDDFLGHLRDDLSVQTHRCSGALGAVNRTYALQNVKSTQSVRVWNFI